MLPAKKAFAMATINGAKTLGKEKQIGSLEVGKLADVVCIDRSHPSVCTVENPYSALVYSCSGRDVRHVFVNGKHIIKNGTHQILNEERIKASAKIELKKLLSRSKM